MTGLFENPDRKLKRFESFRDRATTREEALQRVSKPAKDLGAVSGIQLLVLSTTGAVCVMFALRNDGIPQDPSAALVYSEGGLAPAHATFLAIILFGYALVNMFILIASIRMRQLRNYSMCQFAVRVAWFRFIAGWCWFFAPKTRDALDYPGVEQMFR